MSFNSMICDGMAWSHWPDAKGGVSQPGTPRRNFRKFPKFLGGVCTQDSLAGGPECSPWIDSSSKG
ncbi:hypothetical protein HNQ65_004202 [Prosthecobacter vanneervenii]|uniref:Uncharacterized protein n=1 Tax=Prosthecobacter vanneervenii TaxID=48466 RepID=A0A7W7YEA2_9BACT|nr:hypothetical protein [Prosthecobacter vanneervenii]